MTVGGLAYTDVGGPGGFRQKCRTRRPRVSRESCGFSPNSGESRAARLAQALVTQSERGEVTDERC